jgi:hypothetical protein
MQEPENLEASPCRSVDGKAFVLLKLAQWNGFHKNQQ